MKPQIRLNSPSDRAFFGLAAVLFLGLVLVNYGPVLLGKIALPGHLITQFPVWGEFKSRDLWQPVADIGDTIDYFYPFNLFSAQQIRQWTVPLWNPFVMAGMPFQAEPQTALFYPLHALYYLLATPTAWSLALILRMWLAAMFMTLLMRSVGATKTGAVIAGIAFAFGGFVVAWQGAVMGDAVIWLPLICYSVRRLHLDMSRRSLALAAFAFAMPVLAGHPETAIHLTLTGILAAALLWAFPDDSNRAVQNRFLVFFGLAGFIAIGLGAVQLLPTLEWVQQSGRNVNDVWGGRLAWHQALGFLSRDALRGPNSAGIFVPNAMGYVGMLTLLAASLAPLHRSSRYVIWFAGIVFIGVVVTFGVEPLRSIINQTPLFKGLKNERLVLLIDFGLAALAGLGISALQETTANQPRQKRLLPWLLVGAGFTAAMLAVHQLQLATQFKVEVMRRPSFSHTLLLAALIVVVWKLLRTQRARFFPFVACALLIFDLGTFAYGYTAFTWPDEVFPPAPAFDFLKQRSAEETFRMAPIGLPQPLNSGIAYGLESLTGFEAAVPPALQRFTLDLTEDYPARFILVGAKVLASQDRRFDMLNTKYLVVTRAAPEYELFLQQPARFAEVFKRETIAVFENKTALPRAFIVGAGGVRVIQDGRQQLEAIKHLNFNPLQEVVVDALPAELSEPQSKEEFAGRVEIISRDVNSYRFRVEASAPGIIVVSQNFYPGWNATIEGRPVSVFPANHALTGIAVPAGSHEMHFEFESPALRLGASVSLISLLAFGVLVLHCRRGL
jgi:hypothetical protein